MLKHNRGLPALPLVAAFLLVAISSLASSPTTCVLQLAGAAKHLLHRVYYAQHEFHKKHDRYAKCINELGLANLSHETLACPLVLETIGSRFEATAELRVPDGKPER